MELRLCVYKKCIINKLICVFGLNGCCVFAKECVVQVIKSVSCYETENNFKENPKIYKSVWSIIKGFMMAINLVL